MIAPASDAKIRVIGTVDVSDWSRVASFCARTGNQSTIVVGLAVKILCDSGFFDDPTATDAAKATESASASALDGSSAKPKPKAQRGDPMLVKLTKASRIIGCGKESLRAMIRDGRLPTIRFSNSNNAAYFISMEDIRRLVSSSA